MTELSGEQFLEKYKNRNFIVLMENETVRDFINSYTNIKTMRGACGVLYYMFKHFKEENPDFEIDDFLKLTPVEARKWIWKSVQKYMNKEKYSTAFHIKSSATMLYEFANEEQGKHITWSRKHKIPVGNVKEGTTPTHNQIYQLVNCVNHLDAKAVFLLSYSSGLKGEAFINLTIKDYKEAKEFRDSLKAEFRNQLVNIQDPEEAKDIQYVIDNCPAIIKVTYRIYPKRFTDSTGKGWYPAFIGKDAELMIDKYLAEYRPEAKDDEPLFVGRLSNNRLSQIQLSKWLKYNINKYYKLTGELGDTSPSLVRRSFYNRLISGGMSDIFREYIMGHSIGVKAHYFSWDLKKKDIISQYLKCNFNKINGNYSEKINTLEKDSLKKDERIKQLELQLQEQQQYVQSEDFKNSILSRLQPNFKRIEPSPHPKTIQVKIPLDSGKELSKLLRDGYYITYSNDEIFILEKEIE